MTELFVLSLAIVDSINPSAIVITIYLLARSVRATSIACYIAGIFLSYSIMGLVLLSGLNIFESMISDRISFAIEGILGAAMLGYSLLSSSKEKTSESIWRPSADNSVALFMVGASVTLLELPTALPYFGAMAILTNAEFPTQRWIAILVFYNIIFVLPPVLLVAGNAWFSRRIKETYSSLGDRLQNGAGETMLWIIGIVGFHLLLHSVLYFM